MLEALYTAAVILGSTLLVRKLYQGLKSRFRPTLGCAVTLLPICTTSLLVSKVIMDQWPGWGAAPILLASPLFFLFALATFELWRFLARGPLMLELFRLKNSLEQNTAQHTRAEAEIENLKKKITGVQNQHNGFLQSRGAFEEKVRILCTGGIGDHRFTLLQKEKMEELLAGMSGKEIERALSSLRRITEPDLSEKLRLCLFEIAAIDRQSDSAFKKLSSAKTELDVLETSRRSLQAEKSRIAAHMENVNKMIHDKTVRITLT